jgi:hypothetical protein
VYKAGYEEFSTVFQIFGDTFDGAPVGIVSESEEVAMTGRLYSRRSIGSFYGHLPARLL